MEAIFLIILLECFVMPMALLCCLLLPMHFVFSRLLVSNSPKSTNFNSILLKLSQFVSLTLVRPLCLWLLCISLVILSFHNSVSYLSWPQHWSAIWDLMLSRCCVGKLTVSFRRFHCAVPLSKCYYFRHIVCLPLGQSHGILAVSSWSQQYTRKTWNLLRQTDTWALHHVAGVTSINPIISHSNS